jgi:2-dehydropantoate 2-reductase
VILGAGAVGGTIGGLLRRAGMDVTLLARGEHARVMRERGLTLATPTGRHLIEVDVASSVDDLALHPDDILIATTKTQDTEPVLSQLATMPVLDGRTEVGAAASELPVVCAQNGVENERLALRRFRRVYGICVMLPATQLEPGRVDASGSPYPGILDVGRYPSGVDAVAEEAAMDLAAAGFLSIARAEVMRWKYAKLLRNLGNAIEALCVQQVTTGHEQGAMPEMVRELFERAQAEGRAVLTAAGIDVVSDEEWKAYRRDQVQVAAVEGAQRGGGSSWQSIAKRSGTIEADFLNGEIGLLGRLHRIPTPVNDLLQTEANALARQRRQSGSVSPESLLAQL